LYAFDMPIKCFLRCYFCKTSLTCVQNDLYDVCHAPQEKNKHGIHKSFSNDLKFIRYDHNYNV